MDHHQRALHLFEMLFLPKSRELAIQLAQHARAAALVERMTTVPGLPESEPPATQTVQDTTSPVPQVAKKRLYVPGEEDTQLPLFSQDSQPSQPTQERVNPFSKKTHSSNENSRTNSNNISYVSMMERLSK
jgi:hypothetical protein